MTPEALKEREIAAMERNACAAEVRAGVEAGVMSLPVAAQFCNVGEETLLRAYRAGELDLTKKGGEKGRTLFATLSNLQWWMSDGAMGGAMGGAPSPEPKKKRNAPKYGQMRF